VPVGSGIVGWSTENNELVNVEEAYEDDRFNPDVDRSTGYRTRTVLCAPVRGRDRRVLGAVQVINKQIGVFTEDDESLLRAFAAQAAVAVENINLFRRVVRGYRRMAALLDIATAAGQSRDALELSRRVAERLCFLLRCDRARLYVFSADSAELWGVTQGAEGLQEERFPVTQVLAGRVLHRPIAEGRALVLGGGSIGLLSALLLHARGCRDVWLADTNELRRATAEGTGVCRVYDPSQGLGPNAEAFELVVDAVGAEATRASALRTVKPGGVILHIGLQSAAGELDVRKITLSEITFIGCYTYTPVDLAAAVTALASGSLGSLDWVEERGMGQGPAAFDDLDKGRAAAAKIVLRPE